MAVNTLVTGLIVFKIYKVFRDANIPFRKDASLSSNSSSTGGNRLRSIIFILIESGAALFCIQLIRLTVSILKTNIGVEVFDLIVGIHQMLNVSEYFFKKIPISTLPFLLFFIFAFSNNIFFDLAGPNTYDHPGAGVNGIVFQRRENHGGCSSYDDASLSESSRIRY